MEFSNERGNIFKALGEFRGKVEQPTKDAKNPFFKSSYVMLEGVVAAIDKGIDGTGLSYVQSATSEGDQATVVTTIIHESGEYIVLDPLSLPVSKNDAQAFGSAITYAKRYALSAAFGITSDIDDDGNKATQGKTDAKPSNAASAKQVGLLKVKVMEYCKAKNGNQKEFEEFLNAKHETKDLYTETSKKVSDAIKFVSGLTEDK